MVWYRLGEADLLLGGLRVVSREGDAPRVGVPCLRLLAISTTYFNNITETPPKKSRTVQPIMNHQKYGCKNF